MFLSERMKFKIDLSCLEHLGSSFFLDLERWDKRLLGVSLMGALALDLLLEEGSVCSLSTFFETVVTSEASSLLILHEADTTTDNSTDNCTSGTTRLFFFLIVFILLELTILRF